MANRAISDMVSNRIIDNAGVSVASLSRAAVVAARDQARAHFPSAGGDGALGCCGVFGQRN